jgi:hypothetical protein
MGELSKQQWRDLGIEPPKTAADIRRETKQAVDALPVETKQEFWRLMTEAGLNLGQAREKVGIDVMVAAELVIQCHKQIHIPKRVDEVK